VHAQNKAIYLHISLGRTSSEMQIQLALFLGKCEGGYYYQRIIEM